MAITMTEAEAILAEMMQDRALLAHVRSVSLVMEALAPRYDENPEEWAVAGLLHDADYEKWPEEHPDLIVKRLEDLGEAKIAHAISAHYTRWNVPYETTLDKALLACDELTGFIIAVARVRPNRLQDLTPRSVKKKLKDKSFAAGVDRHEVTTGIELLGVDTTEHIQFIIDVLKPHESDLIG